MGKNLLNLIYYENEDRNILAVYGEVVLPYDEW